MTSDPTFSPAVIVPASDNSRNIDDLLRRLESLGLPVIVVEVGDVAALMSGFHAAANAGHTHAATVGATDKFDPSQIAGLVAAAKRSPRALVLGVRDANASGGSGGSRFTRFSQSLSNTLIFLECGRRLADILCPIRVYPLDLLRAVPGVSGRRTFETEIIPRAVWAGCEIVQVPVACQSDAEDHKGNHPYLVGDVARLTVMHLRLLARALWPWPHRRAWLDPNLPPAAGPRGFEFREALRWLNPVSAWRMIREGEARRMELAASVALGVFIGNSPLYGFHTLLCMYVAGRLHLNPYLAIAGSSVSTPPINFALIAAALCTGHLILRGKWYGLSVYDWRHHGMQAVAGHLLAEWVVGSLVVGGLLALATLVALYLLFGRIHRGPSSGGRPAGR